MATAAAKTIRFIAHARVLHTGATLLTACQRTRLEALFTASPRADDHIEVEATWAVYQRMIAAYRHPTAQRERSR